MDEPNGRAERPTTAEEPTAQEQLFHRLCQLMDTPENIFTDTELDRARLAQLLGTNEHYVSNAVSACTNGGSITDFLNGYRLRYAVRLESLALICQPLDDLTPLNGHVLLRELSLAGSTVADLGGLSQLPSLETLHLEHTAVSDLTPLDGLSGLKTVTVSRDMLPLTWNKNTAFSVVLVT
jgi:hypothetical protein